MPIDEKDTRYDMLDDSDRAEEIRIKKMKQGLIDNTENEEYIKEKEEAEKIPVSFKEKLTNFWYHYKWTVFVVGFFVIGGAILTAQSIFTEKYDTTVLLCSHTYYEESVIENLSTKLADYVDDIDGNGKKSVGVFQAYYKEESGVEVTDYEKSLQARIMAEITSGENCIFIMEKALLDDLASKGAFADLNEMLSLNEKDAVYGVNIKDSRLFANKSFDNTKDDLYIAIRIYKDGTSKDSYQAQVDAVKKIYAEIAK